MYLWHTELECLHRWERATLRETEWENESCHPTFVLSIPVDWACRSSVLMQDQANAFVMCNLLWMGGSLFQYRRLFGCFFIPCLKEGLACVSQDYRCPTQPGSTSHCQLWEMNFTVAKWIQHPIFWALAFQEFKTWMEGPLFSPLLVTCVHFSLGRCNSSKVKDRKCTERKLGVIKQASSLFQNLRKKKEEKRKSG